MKHIKLFEDFTNIVDKELAKPKQHILLDGTSSSGKSAALKKLNNDWAILAADEFYDLMAEMLGNANFGNKQTIDQVYPDCPYLPANPGSDNWENSARWFMAQEAKYGKIKELGLRSRNPEMGRASYQLNVIYDDVQGNMVKEAPAVNLSRPKWILVHAPIDHLKLNVARRPKSDQRQLDSVLVGAYCYKFEALPKMGGVDPSKSWTQDSVKELLGNESWVNQFLTKLGIVDERDYWIYAKTQEPYGDYDVIVNTRSEDGSQKSIHEVANEVTENF